VALAAVTAAVVKVAMAVTWRTSGGPGGGGQGGNGGGQQTTNRLPTS
jgi:hypothetical protein